MKVVAYGIKSHEKILLATVNKKEHDITVIANDLTLETVNYSQGKNALVVSNATLLTTQIINMLSHYGLRLIISWNGCMEDACKEQFAMAKIKVIQLQRSDLENIAEDYSGFNEDTAAIRFVRKTIEILNTWQ